MRRRVFFLIFLLISATLAIYYGVLLPALVRGAIEHKLEKAFQKKIILGGARLGLLQGVRFHRFFIYDPEEKSKIFFRAESLYINYDAGEVFRNFKANGRDFSQWQLTLEINSPEAFLWGWKLEDLYLPLQLGGKEAGAEELKGKFYGGNLEASFGLDFASTEKDYWFESEFSGVDLSILLKERFSLQKDFRGLLDAQLKLGGIMGDANSLKGRGKINLSAGRLGGVPVLRELVDLLGSASLADRVTFSKGRANFIISQGLVTTEDLTLSSEQVGLRARGSINFQGQFSPVFVCKFYLARGLLGGVPLIGRLLASLLDETGNFISQVEVSGSLKETKYKLVPLARGMEDLFSIFNRSKSAREAEDTEE